MNTIQQRAVLISFVLALACLLPSRGEAVGPVPGHSAPPIVAASWVRGAPVEHFEVGRVYVVDLWSTWCKPCIASMPELHALESKFGESVTFIAMNVWELGPKRMPQFMEDHGGTMLAHVALDSVPVGKEANEGLTAIQYLGTSERVSVPKSFIIDQSGLIAWIGLPSDLEEPLSQVLAGTWDTNAFAEIYVSDLERAVKSPK